MKRSRKVFEKREMQRNLFCRVNLGKVKGERRFKWEDFYVEMQSLKLSMSDISVRAKANNIFQPLFICE
jgi:hypothetical protein